MIARRSFLFQSHCALLNSPEFQKVIHFNMTLKTHPTTFTLKFFLHIFNPSRSATGNSQVKSPPEFTSPRKGRKISSDISGNSQKLYKQKRNQYQTFFLTYNPQSMFLNSKQNYAPIWLPLGTAQQKVRNQLLADFIMECSYNGRAVKKLTVASNSSDRSQSAANHLSTFCFLVFPLGFFPSPQAFCNWFRGEVKITYERDGNADGGVAECE